MDKAKRNEILNLVKEKVENTKWTFLCTSFNYILRTKGYIKLYSDTLTQRQSQNIIRKYFPLFKRSTAIKYFGAKKLGSCWWRLDEFGKQQRLLFIEYLRTEKLPQFNKTQF